jgi:hypothetical protein
MVISRAFFTTSRACPTAYAAQTVNSNTAAAQEQSQFPFLDILFHNANRMGTQ